MAETCSKVKKTKNLFNFYKNCVDGNYNKYTQYYTEIQHKCTQDITCGSESHHIPCKYRDMMPEGWKNGARRDVCC
jgi:hypothetical protein